MSAPQLIAEFTQGGKRRNSFLTFSHLINGRRVRLFDQVVHNKREARAIAANPGNGLTGPATCWNF